MQPAEIIVNTYHQIKVALTDRLIKQGYQPVHEQHHDPVYNSCYIIWSNNQDALRLTWDGKEQWFALEVTQELPLSALSPWASIIIAPFNTNSSAPLYQDGIVQQVVESLN